MKRLELRVLCFIIGLVLAAQTVSAQTTVFTYQGSLKSGGSPANGNFDFEFALFDAIAGGAQLGSTVSANSVAVTNGIFSVPLNFGSQFPGANRFLEVRVRPSGVGALTVLSPRQAVNSAPYAVKSLVAETTNNALSLGGVEAGQYITTANGGASFIQNMTTQQASSNFNISGNGTAGIFNAATQYNLGGVRVLSNPGTSNLFAGVGAGLNNTGDSNAFFGYDAGRSNTEGSGNAFFGRNAGRSSTAGYNNAFFGFNAGNSNTTGSGNAFFGPLAGETNTTGYSNAFFGPSAGRFNTTGYFNAFFGTGTGNGNTTGRENSFFGPFAGEMNTTGFGNAFFGLRAGNANTTGNENAFFGPYAGEMNTTGANNAFFGSYAGRANTTGFDNAFFGTNAGNANTTGIYNAFFGRDSGILNTTGGENSFFGAFAGQSNTAGFFNAFFGNGAGSQNTTGSDNVFLGYVAGGGNTTGANNAFFGRDTGNANTTGNNNSAFGKGADVGSNNLTFATAIGSNAVVTSNNRIQLGRNALDTVRIGDLATGTSTQLCITTAASPNNNILAACSSSERYKENIRPLRSGLNLVQNLRPVTFDWKESKEPDLGLIAEDVAKVEPLLVTRNSQGEIQGVKYDQVAVALINAVKEQQAEITGLQAANGEQAKKISEQNSKIEAQQKEIDALKKMICALKPDGELCIEK